MPFCSHCGKEVNGGVKFCPECGEKLKKGFAEEVAGFRKEVEGFVEEVQRNVQELVASAEKVKSGRKTNAKVKSGRNTNSETMSSCPRCGKGIGEGIKFCPECGEKLKKGPAAENIEKHIQEPEASVRKDKSGRNTNIVVWVIVGVVFLLLLLFAGFAEVITCPKCGGTALIEHFCGFCGRDGRITLLEYFIHSLAN
jgi:uncharacterized membrane protein YvbJ